uniref:VQ domain-containing protein n=1 Tax=Globodera pallida TaxID=36090 RepID=A0A183BNA6_GLOPA
MNQQKVMMRMRFNNIVLLLVIILAFCGGRCFGTKGQKKPSAGRQQQTHDEHGSPYLNFEQAQKPEPADPLTTYANVEAEKFKQFVQTMTGKAKATPELPASFQQPGSAQSWIKDLMSTGEHLKPDSALSTAPIMPQNSAMLYNSTGRTSMPMAQHPTASYQQHFTGSHEFYELNNHSYSIGSQPFPTAHGQSSAALALPGGTSTALKPGQSTWMKKGKAKATLSASFKQPKSGRSSGTNFLAGLQPFPTAHGQSTTALALPGDVGGTSTALQPNQSSSNASDAND